MNSNGSVLTPGELEAIAHSRLNPWGKTEYLEKGDRFIRAETEARALPGFSKSQQWAWVYHEVTGCDGVEFEVFSGVSLDTAIAFRGGPIFVPWPDGRPERFFPILQLEDARFTFRKLSGVLHYDGWMPTSDWSKEGIARAFDTIGQAVVVMSVLGDDWCSWRLKYFENSRAMHYMSVGSGQLLLSDAQIGLKLDSLKRRDREVFWNALSLLNLSWNAEDACIGVLLAVSALEALAVALDERGSIAARLPRVAQQGPITSPPGDSFWKTIDELQRALDSAQTSNDLKAARAAWWRAHSEIAGIEATVKRQVERWFGPASPEVGLFTDRIDGKHTLYSIRSLITHHGFGTLTSAEKEALADMYAKTVRTASDYILGVIDELTPPERQAD